MDSNAGLPTFFLKKIMTKLTPKLNKTGKKIRQRLHHKSLMHKTHRKGMGLVFLLRNTFPDVFLRPTKAKKAAIAKKPERFFFGGGEILHNKKGGYNKP